MVAACSRAGFRRARNWPQSLRAYSSSWRRAYSRISWAEAVEPGDECDEACLTPQSVSSSVPPTRRNATSALALRGPRVQLSLRRIRAQGPSGFSKDPALDSASASRRCCCTSPLQHPRLAARLSRPRPFWRRGSRPLRRTRLQRCAPGGASAPRRGAATRPLGPLLARRRRDSRGAGDEGGDVDRVAPVRHAVQPPRQPQEAQPLHPKRDTSPRTHHSRQPAAAG